MKRFLLIVVLVYAVFGALFVLEDYLRLPKKVSEISNMTKGLPATVKIISIERDYDLSRDNHFFVLGDNNHIYEIDPVRQEVIKDITINGLNNPKGFSIARFYFKNKYEYEIFIADTDNNRIVKINLPLNNQAVVVNSEDFLALSSHKPIDVKYYVRYTDKGQYKSFNIAVLIDTHKINSYNLKTKQLEKTIDGRLKVNSKFIIHKNIPYYSETLMSNWGTGPQQRRDDYLESLKDHKVISRAHLSTDIGKISYSEYYVIPDNGNKLIWISSNTAHVGHKGETVRDTMMYRTIEYKRAINSVIRYGENSKETLLVIAYEDSFGVFYNDVNNTFLGGVLNISKNIFFSLIMPFMIPFMAHQ